MRKILHKLLFVTLLVGGCAIYSQTALPGTIEVETGNISNSDVAGNRPVVGDGNGSTNNVLLNIRRSDGKNAEIINSVSIASDGNYDFTFTYYKTPITDANVSINSTDANGSNSTTLKSFGLPRNSNTGATTSSYGTFKVTNVALTTTMTHITIRSSNTAIFDLDNVIVTASPTAPVITLVGSSPVAVIQNETYTDAGATALASDGTTDITGDIVTVNPVNTSVVGTYTVTYNVTNGGVAAEEVTRTVNVYPVGTITSAQTGNWDATTTWTGGVVPTSSNHVVIISGHSVTVPNGVTAEMNNLACQGSTTFTQSAGSAVTVNGNITLERSQDGYVFGGSTTVDMGTLIYSGAPVTKADGTSSPRVRITKAVPDADQWHLLSYGFKQSRLAQIFADKHYRVSTTSGNEGTLAFATYDGSAASGSKYVYPYTSTTAEAITDNDTNITVDGKGYAVNTAAGETNLAWRARLQTDNVSINISDAGDQFNLVGNPYPAYLHANNAADATNNILRINGSTQGTSSVLDEDTIWLWDADNTTFVAKNLGDAAAFRVNPMQAFFVKAKSGGGTTQSFSFTEAMQSHTNTDAFFKSSNDRFSIDLAISNVGKTTSTAVRFIDNMTLDFDNGYDSSMFGGYSSSLEVYTNLLGGNTGKKLAIQSLPNSDFENMVIPVGVTAKANSEITFSANVLNIAKGYDVVLEDRLNNVFTSLTGENSEYTATVTDKNTDGRFFLHVSSSVLSAENKELSGVSLFTTDNSNIRILGLRDGNAKFQLFNILGEQVLSTSFKSKNVNNISLPSLSSGVYIIHLVTESGKLNKKIVLE